MKLLFVESPHLHTSAIYQQKDTPAGSQKRPSPKSENSNQATRAPCGCPALSEGYDPSERLCQQNLFMHSIIISVSSRHNP